MKPPFAFLAFGLIISGILADSNRDHGLREGRGTRLHLRMLMTRYLIEHLPPGPR